MPAGMDIDAYFERVCREGFARRLELLRELQGEGRLKHSISDYEHRLSWEIEIIKQMNFPGYFLIVWDFIRYAQGTWDSGGSGPRISGRFAGGYACRSPMWIRCSTNCSSSAS